MAEDDLVAEDATSATSSFARREHDDPHANKVVMTIRRIDMGGELRTRSPPSEQNATRQLDGLRSVWRVLREVRAAITFDVARRIEAMRARGSRSDGQRPQARREQESLSDIEGAEVDVSPLPLSSASASRPRWLFPKRDRARERRSRFSFVHLRRGRETRETLAVRCAEMDRRRSVPLRGVPSDHGVTPFNPSGKQREQEATTLSYTGIAHAILLAVIP